MKAALILCALAVQAAATQPILVRVTADAIARLREQDPMIRLVKPDEEIEIQRPTATSPVCESTILHDGKHWTLVPKGSVIHLPARLKSKLDSKPIGKLLPWKDFLERNQSWLETAEVSFGQAAGTEEIPAATAAKWSGSGKIIVASHQLGPISVRISEDEKP